MEQQIVDISVCARYECKEATRCLPEHLLIDLHPVRKEESAKLDTRIELEK